MLNLRLFGFVQIYNQKFDAVQIVFHIDNSMTPKSKPTIKYSSPSPSPLPKDYPEFWASLTSQEQILMDIAKDKLGSSFFVQWCHAYKEWKAKQIK